MSKSTSKKFSVHMEKARAEYPIIVGDDLRTNIVTVLKKINPRRVVVISDTSVAKLYGKQFVTSLNASGFVTILVSFAAGEQNKHQDTITKLQSAMFQKKCGRDSVVVALGGGVVGDMAGFVAATYMRGIPYIQVPTTLLAMVDSSIGGKVGIDTKYGKNTVGAFWQPLGVFMDMQYLKKLPPLQLVNGLMEAVKTFFTSESFGLKIAEKIDASNLGASTKALEEVVARSVKIKAGVVERDEREQNERRILNFGHTVGHALEKLSEYSIPHGFAVAFGMLAEVRISVELGILSAEDEKYIIKYLAQFGINAEIFKRFSVAKIIAATYGDKKVKGGKPYYVLLEKIGKVYTKGGQYAHPVEDIIVKKVLKQLGCKK